MRVRTRCCVSDEEASGGGRRRQQRLQQRQRLLATGSIVVIGLLSNRGATAFTPPTPPSKLPKASPAAPSCWGSRPFLLPASSLQLLAITALGPLASLFAAPPPPALAALDLATVSKLQGACVCR